LDANHLAYKKPKFLQQLHRGPLSTPNAAVSLSSDGDIGASNGKSVSSKIKKILITRKYRHQNVSKDIGMEITGGKRTESGELGAFIVFVDDELIKETFGQLHKGDQVLEWNGVVLCGKSFEEVENLVQSSNAEIEVIIRASSPRINLDNEITSAKKKFDSSRLSIRKLKRESAFESSAGVYDVPNTDSGKLAHGKALPSSTENFKKVAANISMNHHGYLYLSFTYDYHQQLLLVFIYGARALNCVSGNPNLYVVATLFPPRHDNTKQTHVLKCMHNPKWDFSMDFYIPKNQLSQDLLEFVVYDSNRPLGNVEINLSDKSMLDNCPRWYELQAPKGHLVRCRRDVAVNDLPYPLYYNPAMLDKSP